MVNVPKIDVQPYLDMLWRRKWWVIICFVLSMSAAGVKLAVTPKIYQASTLILVESQRIPQSYIKTTVSQSVASRLRTISQQVYSRTNLEKIIKEFKLMGDNEQKKDNGFIARIKRKIFRLLKIKPESPQEEDKSPSMLAMVESLRQMIKVQLGAKGKGGQESFTISFEWHDPQVAADVANAIASQFIEENLKVREEMAIGTTKFLVRETEKYRKALERKEKEVEEFKRQNMGMLPEQLASNLSILQQLNEELNSLEQRREQDKQQALMLRNQLHSLQQPATPNTDMLLNDDTGEDGGTVESMVEPDDNIAQLEEKLAALKMRYTDKHPDVVYLSKIIAKLKERQQAAAKSAKGTENDLGMEELSPTMMIEEQLKQVRMNIRNYDQQIAQLKKQIAVYRRRVEMTNQVDLALTKLTRDYKTMQKRYQDLLARKLDAQMAEEMEKRQKGEQFRVLDPAVPPDLPIKPNVPKILMLALFLGLGGGFGLAYLREILDPAFYTPEDLEAYLRTRVLVNLPLDNASKKSKA
ncbi:MAG: hypothetical protein JRJ56_04680 [Deltaproteobacteria bacterium]|nr:hypothetical protein [Deltaproteobacteria bacterium]